DPPKRSTECTKNSNYPTPTNSKTEIYIYKREQSVNSNERKQTTCCKRRVPLNDDTPNTM
ncbi:19703_t:CDS:1, partial [Gigaspora rosea]